MKEAGQEIEKIFEGAQNRLVVQTSDFSLSGLKEMVDERIIDLSPQYQRRERWDLQRQSQLIESFLLNVPVPPIYLAEEEYGQYSIIDGKQRISCVTDYLNNSFSLKGLEKFSEIEGYRFRELPRGLQNALRVRPYLRVITLLRQSDPELKYEVFIRLNRGGIRLNNQEIRNVAFRGALNDLIYEKAKSSFLRKSLNINDNRSSAYQQMSDAEYVLRFLTLFQGWQNFSGSLSRSMDSFMLDHREASGAEIGRYGAAFELALSRCESLWGEVAFQRWDGERWRQQFLAGMYDAQMISASALVSRNFVKQATTVKS